MKISDTSPFFKQPHLFYQPLRFYGKNLNRPFFKIFENSTPSFIKRGAMRGGGRGECSNYALFFQVKKVTLTDWKIATTFSL